MPLKLGYKCKLQKSSKHSPKPSKKGMAPRTSRKPPWNDAVNDLSAFAATPEEICRRRLIHRSKNAEKARLQLLEKKLSLCGKFIQDSSFPEDLMIEKSSSFHWCTGSSTSDAAEMEEKTNGTASEYVHPRALNEDIHVDWNGNEMPLPVTSVVESRAETLVSKAANNILLDHRWREEEEEQKMLRREVAELKMLVTELTKEVLYLRGCESLSVGEARKSQQMEIPVDVPHHPTLRRKTLKMSPIATSTQRRSSTPIFEEKPEKDSGAISKSRDDWDCFWPIETQLERAVMIHPPTQLDFSNCQRVF